MLARDTFGPGAVARADRLDQQAVLVLGDEQRLAGARQPFVRGEERIRGRERQGDDIRDARSSTGLLASRTRPEWNAWFSGT